MYFERFGFNKKILLYSFMFDYFIDRIHIIYIYILKIFDCIFLPNFCTKIMETKEKRLNSIL